MDLNWRKGRSDPTRRSVPDLRIKLSELCRKMDDRVKNDKLLLRWGAKIDWLKNDWKLEWTVAQPQRTEWYDDKTSVLVTLRMNGFLLKEIAPGRYSGLPSLASYLVRLAVVFSYTHIEVLHGPMERLRSTRISLVNPQAARGQTRGCKVEAKFGDFGGNLSKTKPRLLIITGQSRSKSLRRFLADYYHQEVPIQMVETISSE
ncbi:hypothetical protein V8F33_003513 [Rhypophila sp. PSN 637]